MLVRQLFDLDTWTYTYLLVDESTGKAALIDPVRERVDRDLALVDELGAKLEWVLETHVHADHVTGADEIRRRTGARTIGGKKGAECADIKVAHGDVIDVGNVALTVLETPGHTDDSLSFAADGHVFTGDALFVRGTGRTDFQNGDPKLLWHSLTRVLFALPDGTIVWPGHDYRGHTCSTIGEEKQHNPRIVGKTEAEFVTLMNELDLPRPKYIDVDVPANRKCGREEARH